MVIPLPGFLGPDQTPQFDPNLTQAAAASRKIGS